MRDKRFEHLYEKYHSNAYMSKRERQEMIERGNALSDYRFEQDRKEREKKEKWAWD